MTAKSLTWVIALIRWKGDQVVVEIKCVEAIPPVHHAQPLSYMRLSGKSPGLLINFYLAHLRDGIQRMVDGKSWQQ